MSIADRLRRSPAALALAAGAGVFGFAVGGIASVDADLRAAAPAAPTDARFVVDRPGSMPEPASASDWCDDHHEDRRPTDTTWKEL